MKKFQIILSKTCPICNSNEGEFFVQKYDDRFGQPDLFEYYYCKKCDIVFLKNKIQEVFLAELYKKYYGKGKRLSAKSNNLKLVLQIFKLDKFIFQWLAGNKDLLNNIENGVKVLEIGSGYNFGLKKVIEEKKIDWTGLEVDEELFNYLKNDGLKAIHGTIKLNNIQDKYDYVISSQSIEHQYDINDFFENSKKFLKNNGKIIFTTPNFDSRYRKKYGSSWINWHAPYHVLVLSRNGVENLCEKHDLVISEFFTYTPTSWYMLQRNFKIPKRGKINPVFNFNFSLVTQLFVSIFLRIYEFFKKKTGDCIYCEIKLKNNK